MMPNQPNSLPEIAGAVLDDLRYYLSVIDPVTYQAPLDILSGSTIGQHTRHIIEFYNCLLEQSFKYSPPVINYSKRRRDHQIESEPDHALGYVQNVSEQLRELDPDRACQLDCAEHGQDGLMVGSTIGRELIYNIEHTIHHLAIVKIALRATVPTIILPEHFGVAPSTIRYRQEACAQ
ncbi:MAG TPA: hypothetical protein VJ508_00420 [Saprospiraceae bacterium]|nr:hypothetical protein [Saprospiraceae bacterium]